MNTTKINFRNHQLAVYSNHNTSAPALIFLHGNSSSSRTWERQFTSDLNSKYHLIAFDLLGFGYSDHANDPAADYDITSLSASLLAVIDHFNLQEYFLIGHSLGGHLMVQTLDQLPGCKGIISIGAPPISSAAEIGNFYLTTAPTGVMFVNEYSEDALESVAENFFYHRHNEPEFFKEDFRRADGRSREAIGHILASPYFKNEVEVLSRNKTPKAFVTGRGERSINNEYYHTLDFPGTWQQKIFPIEDSAHLPQWENAEEVNKLIDDFVRANC